MATSFVPVSNTKNGFTIVTQVVQGPPEKTGSNISTPGPVQRLLKGEPKALGTVQIMIGILTLSFGIVSTVNVLTVSVITGVTLWGPIFYIISGAFSVAVGNKARPCVVKVSLIMNVISSVIAGVAMILLSFSMYKGHPYYWRFIAECLTAEHLSKGVDLVLLVFSLLELIVSICSSAFACKASCCPEIMESHVISLKAKNVDDKKMWKKMCNFSI